MVAGAAARAAALTILRAVRVGQPFDQALAAALSPLADADRRLSHEIAAGVLRSRIELDRRLARLVRRRWTTTPDDLKDLLRIGAYQLLKLSRVPPYAAVGATVEAAKQSRRASEARLVNAVLRRLAREAGEPDGTPVASEAPGLAARYSHPGWLVDRWLARFGLERTAALLAHNNRRPPIALQPLRWTRADLAAALTAAGVAWRQGSGGAILVERVRVRRLPGYDVGGFIVQDPAQTRLLAFAAVTTDGWVWDPCAAPGGKTAVLARHARLLASDLSRARMGRLRETIARAAPEVSLFRADARHPPLPDGRVAAVLLDAPCTATGTVARHPDARWRLSRRRLAGAATRQRALLDGVAPVVHPGGVLVYMTCSLESEENDEVVDAFLARHPEYARTTDDLFLFPPDTGTDGGYAARLQRVQ